MKNFKNLCVRIICWVIRTVAPTWAIEKGILRSRKKRNGRWVDNKYATLLCPKVEKIVEYFHNHHLISEAFLVKRVWPAELVSKLFADKYTYFNSNGKVVYSEDGNVVKDAGYCFNFLTLAPFATEADLTALITWAPNYIVREAIKRAKTPSSKWLMANVSPSLAIELLTHALITLNGLSFEQLLELLSLEKEQLDTYLAIAVGKNPERWAADVMCYVGTSHINDGDYEKAYTAAFNAVKKVDMSRWLSMFFYHDFNKFIYLLNHYNELKDKENYLLETINVLRCLKEEDLEAKGFASYKADVNAVLLSEVYASKRNISELQRVAEAIKKNWSKLECLLGRQALFEFVINYGENFAFFNNIARTEEEEKAVQKQIIERGQLYDYFPFAEWNAEMQKKAIQKMVDMGSLPTSRLEELSEPLQAFAKERLQVASELKAVQKDAYGLEQAISEGMVFLPEVEARLVTRDDESAIQSAIIEYISRHKMSLIAWRALVKFRSSYGVNFSCKRVLAHVETWGLEGEYLLALQGSPFYSSLAGAYTAKQRAKVDEKTKTEE